MSYFSRAKAQEITDQLLQDFSVAASQVSVGISIVPYVRENGMPENIDTENDVIYSVSLATAGTFSDDFKQAVMDRVAEIAGREVSSQDVEFMQKFRVIPH